MSTIHISPEVMERLGKAFRQSQEVVQQFGKMLVDSEIERAINRGLVAGAKRAEGLKERQGGRR